MPGEHDLPRTGTDADFIDRLADYVETFRPGWSQRVRGADEAEIAELERLSGARYPDTYRRWLTFCGHDDDGLLDSLEGRLGKIRTVGDLRDLYADDDPREWAERHPVVLGSEIGVYLALRSRIVLADSGTVFADSWEKLVFQHAAFVRGVETFPGYRWTSVPALATTPATFAAEHGFTTAWFSDDQHVCLVRHDALVWTSLYDSVLLVVAGGGPLVDAFTEQLSGGHPR